MIIIARGQLLVHPVIIKRLHGMAAVIPAIIVTAEKFMKQLLLDIRAARVLFITRQELVDIKMAVHHL